METQESDDRGRQPQKKNTTMRIIPVQTPSRRDLAPTMFLKVNVWISWSQGISGQNLIDKRDQEEEEAGLLLRNFSYYTGYL